MNLMHMAFITRCSSQFVHMKGRGDPFIISFITKLVSVQKISTGIHHVCITAAITPPALSHQQKQSITKSASAKRGESSMTEREGRMGQTKHANKML